MEHKQWVSRYRDELKGIAILWVVLFHMGSRFGGVLGGIQKIGYGGVDIFFFLTGFGLYHSLSKNDDLRDYWMRRMKKLLPTYLPFIVCWVLVWLPSAGLRRVQGIRSVIGNFFGVGYWLNVPEMFNWYVGALLLYLVFAPLFYALLSKSEKPLRTLAILLGVSYAVGMCCIGTDQYMALSRLPILIVGMAFAMNLGIKMSPALKRSLYWAAFVGSVYFLLRYFDSYEEVLLDYGLYWHLFVLITPTLCIGLAYGFHKLEKARAAFAPLRIIGKASFAIYLADGFFVTVGRKLALESTWEWVLLSVAGVLLGIGYDYLVNACVKAYHRHAAAKRERR